MPRGSSTNVAGIFEQFVQSLSALIKEKVAEAVHASTADFLSSKFGGVVTAEEPTHVRHRRRRRRGGKKPDMKPVRLSKHGKRLGRPPKAKPAE